jgi:2-keto-4-pentenoate hydratase/2-oxohepta-3-ene-1,7-dioic acid hydratase in catechol pathway
LHAADDQVIVGLAVKEGKVVKARVLSSSSALDEGAKFKGEERPVKQVRLPPREQQGTSTHSYEQILAPVTAEQVGSIRCIGVNYNDHGVSTIYR